MGNSASSAPTIQQQQQQRQEHQHQPAAPSSSSLSAVVSNSASNGCPIEHSKLDKSNPSPLNSYNNNNNQTEIDNSAVPPATCPSSSNAKANNSSSTTTSTTTTTGWWKSLPFAISSFNNNSSGDASSASMAPQLPPSLEEAARHAQIRQYQEQRRTLSTERVISSIPRADTIITTATTDAAAVVGTSSSGDSKNDDSSSVDAAAILVPPHQLNTDNPQNHWVYPSEQQFYNALRRKGWKHVPEDLIPNIVQIHNAVNEQGWRQVCYWERIFLGHSSMAETRQALRLVQLVGRPTTKSLHVYMSQMFFPERQWFDRHDWYVDRNNGQAPRRYMLDFYEIQPTRPSITAADRPPPVPVMYLHVRPALDSPQAVLDRWYMFVRNSFPGTALLMDQFQQYKRQQLQEQMAKQAQQQQKQQQQPRLGQYASASSSSTTPASVAATAKSDEADPPTTKS